MTNYDERKVVRANACPLCKYCYAGEIVDSNDLYHFCLLGVSKEDREYVEDEIWERGGVINFSGEPYSPKLIQIMKLEESDYFTDSPRYVRDYDTCQFFEEEGYEE